MTKKFIARSEADIEEYLVKRVRDLGGEIRKVKWIGRRSAPDRRVMIPAEFNSRGLLGEIARAFWVEVKAPGKLATFPADARERAQAREHERMRRCGERVVLVDSFDGVDEVLG